MTDLIAGGTDIGTGGKLPEHGVQPLVHILGDTVEQEGDGPLPQRTALSRAQQSAIEQVRRSGRVRGHAGWYADLPSSGNQYQRWPLSVAQRSASLRPWRLRHHFRVPFPITCAARCGPATAHGPIPRGWHSISRYRRGVWPAANRSPARASAPRAGQNCRSSRHRSAPASAFPLSTIPVPGCCRCRRSPILQPISAPVPTRGRWMARAGQELLSQADALVPVPLHWRRGWSRRYNQSGALARVIERQSGVPVAGDALRRVRATQQRIGLSKSERATNVQGAFKVAADRKGESQGRHIVLIDDVLTSGATVDACARALLRAKAAQVDVLVFARVVDAHKAPI